MTGIGSEQERRLHQVLAAWMEAEDRGERPSPQELVRAHPDLGPELEAFFQDRDQVERLAREQRSTRRFLSLASLSPGAGAADPVLPPGTRLGPYFLEEVLGRGGMGTVYRATHERLQRPVALKVLPPRLAYRPEFVHRFEREARTLARLQHPNIVQVHDMGVQGELYYIGMERVEGVDLRTLMRSGALSPEQALAIVPQVCDALAYAHGEGVVHRDIKPENILLTRDGVPKVVDFGLARLVEGEGPPEPHLTRTDMLVGTRSYMAPEQWKSARVDHRADIYSLGLVLYEMLTGELPAGRFDPPSRKSPVDLRIDRVVEKALEQDPERRYQQAATMGSAVSDVLDRPGAPGEAVPLIDASTGRVLARCTEPTLRVIMKGWDELHIKGWQRPEIGVKTRSVKVYALGLVRAELGVGEKPLGVTGQGAGQEGRPLEVEELSEGGLCVHLTGWDSTLHVPPGLKVEVLSSRADVEVDGMHGDLHLWSSDEDAVIRDHHGRLTVERVDSGSIQVLGLHTDQADLRTETGWIRVDHLRLSSGTLSLTSRSGYVECLADPEHCSFDYEAESSSGRVEVERVLGEPRRQDPRAKAGRVAQGGAALHLRSTRGTVRLGLAGTGRPRRRHRGWILPVGYDRPWWHRLWMAAGLLFAFYYLNLGSEPVMLLLALWVMLPWRWFTRDRWRADA